MWMCVCVYTHVCTFVYMYMVSMYVCIYMHMYKGMLVLVLSHSVVSDSLEPHGARQAPLCMGFSGKNTGVGCHSHA